MRRLFVALALLAPGPAAAQSSGQTVPDQDANQLNSDLEALKRAAEQGLELNN